MRHLATTLWIAWLLFVGAGALPANAAEGPIAIDVYLEPDSAFAQRARDVNAQLLLSHPDGFRLVAAHAPRISLVQCWVDASKLDAVTGAVSRVIEKDDVLAMAMTATGYDFGTWGDLGIAVLKVDPDARLRRLEADLASALRPYMLSDSAREELAAATASASVGAGATARTGSDDTLFVARYVENFGGERFAPRAIVGVAQTDILRRLRSEPFEPFTFKPADVAIGQPGTFGALQTRLWSWKGTRR
jgi:hypothetical protein